MEKETFKELLKEIKEMSTEEYLKYHEEAKKMKAAADKAGISIRVGKWNIGFEMMLSNMIA